MQRLTKAQRLQAELEMCGITGTTVEYRPFDGWYLITPANEEERKQYSTLVFETNIGKTFEEALAYIKWL